MPSFSLYPLKRMTSMDSPLAKGTPSSPRSSDDEVVTVEEKGPTALQRAHAVPMLWPFPASSAHL